MKTIKLLILCLIYSQLAVGQSNNVTTEDVFKRYLISEDESIAKMIINTKDNFYSLYCLGAMTEDLKEKINYFTKYISLNPKYGIAKAYLNRGIAYSLAEKYDSALVDFNKSIELDSEEPYTFYFRGEAYHSLEQDDKAIEDFSKAIEMQSNFVLAYQLRGSAFLNLKNYKSALSDLNKVIEINKNQDEAFILRGLVYDEMGEYVMAIEDWKKAKRINKNNAQFLDEIIEKTKVKLKDKK